MTRKHSAAAAAAALVALLMSGASATVMAQNTKAKTDKMPQHQEGMKGMTGMMGGPHHVLAMAYRDNLATFARALRGQVNQSKSVNLDLARPAVAEMRRSLSQLQEHHQAHMRAMTSANTDSAMPGNRLRMETRLTALGEHLTALESAVNASAPDYRQVAEHATKILNQSASMSSMPDKAKPHQMR